MTPVRKHFMCGILLAACLTVLSGCGRGGDDDGDQPDQIYEVVRGNFNIITSANGTLDAIKRYRVEAPHLAKKGLDIIEAVLDQTSLKKGDLIVAFSDEQYLDELESREIKIEEAEKNLMLLLQDYQMKIADSVSLIKKATDTHRVSIESLEKYQNEDAPLSKKNLILALNEARQNIEEEEQNLVQLKENLLSASMGDEAARAKIEKQVLSSEATIEELENNEEKAAYNLRIFKQYTYPQKSRELERNVVKAEMDLQKQLVNAAAQRVQLERKINTQRRVLASEERKREDLLENISLLNVTAPVDGIVSYGNPDPRQRHRQQKDIIVGANMKASELIGTIPDMSQLIVKLDVPESARSKVHTEMHAEMRIKALPNIRLSGEVTKVSDLAAHLVFWDRTSPKVYPVVVSIDQNLPELRTGMTVEVDLISEQVIDVVYVPVEALFVKEGDVFCQVKKAMGEETREVTIGRSSGSFVEVVSGLKAGERVLLSREEL